MVCVGHLVVVLRCLHGKKMACAFRFSEVFLRPVGRMACMPAGDGDTNAINKQTI